MSRKKDKEIDFSKILYEERINIEKYMSSFQETQVTLEPCRGKNMEASIQFRQQGNEVYRSKLHDGRIHVQVWRLYSQSIAFARNDSEELALGYGNRSAFLFHLKIYEDCIKDCDRAIKITPSKILKSKLLCRKAECLALLNENSAKQVCEEALNNLSELPISYDLKRNFIDKMQNILKTIPISKFVEQINISKKSFNDLTKFKRNKEVPCASTAAAIRYNEQWGRHITATRNIKPGEIIGIEKVYFTSINSDGMYLYCSYCTQPTWSSIPCQHCVYEMYCSEKCLSEALIKYHEFECSIYPYLQDIPNLSNCKAATRFLLITLYDAGGIQELKNDLLDIEESKDQRKKGFSSEGIFESNKPKTLYSLNIRSGASQLIQLLISEIVCKIIFVLGTKTNFFRKKITLTSEMILDDDIKFIGALLLRIFNIFSTNGFTLTHQFETEKIQYGSCLKAFGSLFNHSCDPNIDTFISKNNETVYYAKKPVMKGSQLFISYIGENFLDYSKSYRQSIFQNQFNFTCRCLACLEDWSQICLPRFETLLEFTPRLMFEILPLLGSMKEISKVDAGEKLKYNPELMREVVHILEIISKKLTTNCNDYREYENYIRHMLLNYFGHWDLVEFDKCSSHIMLQNI